MDFHKDHHDNRLFGFWSYILTDCILFASLFAVFAVLMRNTFDGPSMRDIVNIPFVFMQTMLLLLSSFSYGMAMIFSTKKRSVSQKKYILFFLFITFFLGLAFILMEAYEFYELVHEGYSWKRSAFLSSFFALVGTHGLHVFSGLIWMIVIIIQVAKYGTDHENQIKIQCLGLFWHFLDLIWIFVFTIVYLMGSIL